MSDNIKETNSKVHIADEVIAIIAGIAATEVEGVASMSGNITNKLISSLGVKNLAKGVKVEISENYVSVLLSLNIKYNYNIAQVSKNVQEKVKMSIENMTGFEVIEVNIKIAGVRID